MNKQIIALVAALALIGGAFAYGYHKGSVNEIQKAAEETAQKQKELFNLADIIEEQAKALLQLEEEKKELINALEDEATKAVGSSNPGVGSTGGLRRLELRWGTSPRSSK